MELFLAKASMIIAIANIIIAFYIRFWEKDYSAANWHINLAIFLAIMATI